jgi:SAM-dependent methyltransferase
MFFESPAAAFSNVASALRPDGRFVFLCWQGRERNEWVTATVSAALEHVPSPAPGPEGAPGPFSLGKPDRIRRLLTDAGFASVDIGEIAEPVLLGADAGVAAGFWQGTGTARALLDDVDTETERRAIDAVRDVLRSHEGPDGVWLGSAAWLVIAMRA